MRFFQKYFTMSMVAFLLGCSPSCLEDFRSEGEQHCKVLLEELQKIRTREQLVRAVPVLKKHFEDLVALMIHARQYQQEHPEEAPPLFASENAVSALLEGELKRIYAMEGGRETIERAQEEALVRLDAFKRRNARSAPYAHSTSDGLSFH